MSDCLFTNVKCHGFPSETRDGRVIFSFLGKHAVNTGSPNLRIRCHDIYVGSMHFPNNLSGVSSRFQCPNIYFLSVWLFF